MIHQDQYSRRRDLTISLPQNNMEAVCPPGLWKGMFYKTTTEYVKKKIPLSLITHCAIPNFFSTFSFRNTCIILGNKLSCTSTHGGGANNLH